MFYTKYITEAPLIHTESETGLVHQIRHYKQCAVAKSKMFLPLVLLNILFDGNDILMTQDQNLIDMRYHVLPLSENL